MSDFNERIQASLDTVLAETCRELPNGGDHEIRKYIAEHRRRYALEELRIVARSA